jgi:hypothetical protein
MHRVTMSEIPTSDKRASRPRPTFAVIASNGVIVGQRSEVGSETEADRRKRSRGIRTETG